MQQSAAMSHKLHTVPDKRTRHTHTKARMTWTTKREVESVQELVALRGIVTTRMFREKCSWMRVQGHADTHAQRLPHLFTVHMAGKF